MRIAQVAPLYESVPPACYGGTERVVSYLTEELVRLGHDVTLFASGDSSTRAALVPACPRALRTDPDRPDPLVDHVLLLEKVCAAAADFDVVHFHTEYFHLPAARRLAAPRVSTLHGQLSVPHYDALFREFADEPFVSISDAQRLPLPALNWRATVSHGLPPDLYSFGAGPGRYLLFLGRISPEKGPHVAIEIAERFGMELLIAAKVDEKDRSYFENWVKPLIRGRVRFIGEVSEPEKGPLLRGAFALLFPIAWSEPFGMVLIEAMACGTPVVAFRRGSVPEIVEDGVTGFAVSDVAGAVAALDRVRSLDRGLCRRAFERRFTDRRMAADYLAVYAGLAERASGRPGSSDGAESAGLSDGAESAGDEDTPLDGAEERKPLLR